MNFEKSRDEFCVPLTFPSVSILRTQEGQNDTFDTHTIFDTSLAKATPTVLEYWSHPGALPELNNKDGSRLVVGCKDGTVYVLRHQAPSTPPVCDLPPPQEQPKSKTTKRLSKSSQPYSGASSPTMASFPLSPTFNVTAKPRVVSGVTTEAVEAPKNYVDFDDEPDKLKDILKGRNPRERHSESASDRNSRSTPGSIVEPVPISKRKNAAPRSLLSATNSRAPTPPSFSSPSSPRDSVLLCNGISFCDYTLLYHIVPSVSPPRHSVQAIQFLEEGAYFSVLHENGDLNVYSFDDGSCAASYDIEHELRKASPPKVKERPKSQDTWAWIGLTVAHVDESVILVASATNENDVSDTNSSPDISRCVLLELAIAPAGIQLNGLGQWDLGGPAKGGIIHEESHGSWVLFSASHEGHLRVHDLTLRDLSPSLGKMATATPPGNEGNHFGPHLSTLPIPNPFKSMMSRSSEHLPPPETETHSPAETSFKPFLSEPQDLGVLIPDTPLSGLKIHGHTDGKIFGLAWSHQELSAFECSQRSMTLLFCTPVCGIENAIWIDHDTYALSFKDRVELYQIKLFNADNEEVNVDSSSDASLQHQPVLVRTVDLGEYDAIKFTRETIMVAKSIDNPREMQILSYVLLISRHPQSPHDTPHILWHMPKVGPALPPPTLTSILPLELELIVQGYSDGVLRQFSLAQMSRKNENEQAAASSSMKTSSPPLNGSVVGLHIVQNPRTREKFIVGGADDGSVAFWSLSKFELVARWTIFVAPLIKVIQFEADTAGPLRGCALCISRDGTIAVIIIDGFHFRYLIPGSVAPLKRICLGGNNLLVIYGDHHARLWDSQTKELWRSIGEDKAEELLGQGGWIDLAVETDVCVPETSWSPVSDPPVGQDIVASLVLDLERVIVDAISLTKTISTSRNEVRGILLTLDRLRLLLSALLTPGLNADVDSICYGKLGAYPSSVVVGLSSPRSTSLFQPGRPQDVWRLSGLVSASRALAIIAVLRAMSLFEDLTEGANTVILFYSTSLGNCVGPSFKPPSLEFLGKLWFEVSHELRQPIRTLFDATIANMSDEESIAVTEKWQHHVPALQPDAEKETVNAALALFICGCIASEKYSLLSTNALTDISKSISLFLTDEKSVYRILAIDLCSRGFNVWQQYIDAMDILRSLFDLATGSRKDTISVQNIGPQARLAVLSIATNNMPLFMGTLCLDILSPLTVEHQRSVLQILAFLIKKRPQVLQSNLPRLMEVVVKSLDPNSTANRDMVLDTATEIIGYVVKTFPSVDFHMASQRLAVGTNEGAVVMYDLKTAIRLYVLEGHKKPITACSFSPDGRRLVTISLKDSSVLVWKVGSSFASFFHPGAPPRQGNGGSLPFKTLNFNIGSEADMTIAQTLELVRVEWIADRSVRVKIRQSIMTFSA